MYIFVALNVTSYALTCQYKDFSMLVLIKLFLRDNSYNFIGVGAGVGSFIHMDVLLCYLFHCI